MSDDTQQPIVVKKIKKGGGGAHGGAWKIAYADFVTAMMAFFLLMWLLGSTAQGDLQGIAEFFNSPLKVAMSGGSGAGDATSPIVGGGQDLTRSVGQVKRGDVEGKRSLNLEAAKGAVRAAGDEGGQDAEKKREERKERARLEDLKGQIEAIIEASPSLRPFKSQLLLDITTEGLRIQIVDEQNRPMFDSSSASLRPYTQELLRSIGATLNGVDNTISLSGHTDSTRYAGGERGFSNWELSANRANASRRELVAGGLAEGKIVRVVGLADTLPLDSTNPTAPLNRRISIIVLNKQAEAALRGGSDRKLDVNTGGGVDIGDIRAGLGAPPRPAPRQAPKESTAD
ncbi:flagellar motor protein MotB [Thauera aminoaromatica]|uniref:Flagellar motor protein MotB n=1 Tax=Thauera aminoaromatica TaxID=164330 RepID=A0A5C7T904_THASP|nr:flagellar motor protein MotB [Thauera aminoaromatica]TXH92167.1 MAG: flagellar motor protein MotB [Thauera aminoaromatica]